VLVSDKLLSVVFADKHCPPTLGSCLDRAQCGYDFSVHRDMMQLVCLRPPDTDLFSYKIDIAPFEGILFARPHP
jgi:hypothetical protein